MFSKKKRFPGQTTIYSLHGKSWVPGDRSVEVLPCPFGPAYELEMFVDRMKS